MRVGYLVYPNDLRSLFTSTHRKDTLRQILQWSFARVIQFRIRLKTKATAWPLRSYEKKKE